MHLLFLLRSEIVLDVKLLTNFFGGFALEIVNIAL
jgi:hypothetical protein